MCNYYLDDERLLFSTIIITFLIMTENSFDQQVVIKNYKIRFLILKKYIKNFSQYYWTLWRLMILCL